MPGTEAVKQEHAGLGAFDNGDLGTRFANFSVIRLGAFSLVQRAQACLSYYT